MNGRILHLVETTPPRDTGFPSVFINYRSSDEPWAAMFLRRALATRFGPHAIFIDHAGIAAGEDFRPALLRAVVRISALLAVIGPELACSIITRKTAPRRRIGLGTKGDRAGHDHWSARPAHPRG